MMRTRAIVMTSRALKLSRHTTWTSRAYYFGFGEFRYAG